MANTHSYVVEMLIKQSYAPGMGVNSEERHKLYTHAVSTRQAISNVKKQYDLKSTDLVVHGQYGYCRRISFSAVRV